MPRNKDGLSANLSITTPPFGHPFFFKKGNSPAPPLRAGDGMNSARSFYFYCHRPPHSLIPALASYHLSRPPNGMEGALPLLRATTGTTVKACLFRRHPPQRKQRKPHLHSVWPLTKPKKPHHNEPQALTKKPCGYGAKRNPVKLAGRDEQRRLQQPTCPCESRIPFGPPALARHCLP